MAFFDIDIPTAIKLCAMADLSIVALLWLYRYEGGSKRALSFFVYGQFLRALGMLLISFRGIIPLLLSAHVGNILVYIGIALEIFAFTLISPSRFRLTEPLIAVVVTGALLFASIDFLYPDQAVAKTRYVLVSSLVISSLYALGGLSLFGATCSSRLRKGLGAIFIVLALCFLGRLHPSFAHGMNIFTPGLIQSLTFVAILIATIVCGIGFMLLMHEAADKALRLAATTDALTGLANRRRFNEVLNTEFFRLKRSGAPLSLIILDVDYFKRFNDRYGHVQGDECLRAIGQAIKASVHRPPDLAARFGGEEFVVIAPETGANGALALAERIRHAVTRLEIPHEDNTAAPHVTASLGVATRYASELETPESLVELADQALYQAKHSGRNQTQIRLRQEDEVGKRPGFVRLLWNDMAESGHPRLDEEHKALFDQANLLLSAIADGQTKAECRVLLDRAMEIIAGHFRDEIELIATTPFPDIDHHRRCHQALLGKVVKMSERFDHDELSISELFGFLAHDVIVQHIMGEDRKFFPYLPTPDLEG